MMNRLLAKAKLPRLLRWVLLGALVLILASAGPVVALRWLHPPITGLMLERKLQARLAGESLPLHYQWRAWQDLPDGLKMAVIAGEDQHFPEHWGFDLPAIRAALAHNQAGGHLRGASTISQQTAKNLFLWSGRNWLRKGLEAWFTLEIEALWPKQRILETYLNTVEWGDGIFGAQAAAQYYFGVDAKRLTAEQAARLAAILPNPHHWSAAQPIPRVQRRADGILQQIRQLGGAEYLQRL